MMRKISTLPSMIVIFFILCGISFAERDEALLAAAQKRKPAFLQDLATLVNIDSGTDYGKGLAEVELILAQRLKDLGAEVEVLAAPPAAGRMVMGTFQGTGVRNILLMIHYDTVFGPGEAARRPFRINGTRAFGPGVADAKGGALIILYALDIARERGFRGYKRLTVLFNPNEEKGSPGARDVIRKVAWQQDYVFIYEPARGDLVTVGTKGVALVHLDVKGLASHAGSAPEKGHNAAVELAHQIMQLNDLGDSAKGTTVNWTVIHAGDRFNIIPDKASATADMRICDPREIERVQRDADRIIEKRLIPETEVNLRVEYLLPPCGRNPGSDKLAALANSIYQELGRTIAPQAARSASDAGWAHNPASSKPFVLDAMGIIGNRLHSPDEWADLDSIVPRLYLTVRMLEALAKAGWEQKQGIGASTTE